MVRSECFVQLTNTDMNRFAVNTLVASGIGAVMVLPNLSQAQASYTGTVEQVWEDGLRLNIGDRTLRVDTWDIYGDNTPSYTSAGDELTITGEFNGREFDAFSIIRLGSDSTLAPATMMVPITGETTDANPGTYNTYTDTVVPASAAVTIQELQQQEPGLIIAGEIISIVGNEFILSDGTGQIIVDAGPMWYHQLNLQAGEQVTVVGEYDDYDFDAFTITRENSEILSIRNHQGPPPWAGGANHHRNHYED